MQYTEKVHVVSDINPLRNYSLHYLFVGEKGDNFTLLDHVDVFTVAVAVTTYVYEVY